MLNQAHRWDYSIFFRRIGLVLSVILAFVLLASCTQDPEVIDPPQQYGSIQGRVLYSNGDDHSGIVVTLDKTDGLRAITREDDSREIVSLATSSADGSFAFYNLEPGTYTIYATSNDSVEKGVATNVVVSDASTVTIEDLLLTATGSITGYVQIDGQSSGNSGFLVSIAGTSFMATTNDQGYYCITGIPAGEGYQLIITRGSYISNTVSECTVSPKGLLRVGVTTLSSADLDSGNNALIWKGSFNDASELPNPKTNWAFFNKTDGCSYIYDGTQWTLLASKGDKGDQGEQGVPGETGASGSNGSDGASIVWKGSLAKAPNNPSLYWAYFNTGDGCSYIYDGTQWTLLAERGAQGVQGEAGATGAAGADGISIIWLGSFATAPANPEKLNAYYNTQTGCSYIYNGTSWDVLASKGDQGETGATGTSITWKGSLATVPSNPSLYWAYFNTGDGCSYIYDGTQWTLLAERGAQGDQGIQGETGIQGEPGAAGANGQPIIWLGSYSSPDEIDNPSYLCAFFNTSDGCSYIYDGVQWTTLAASGAMGETGLSIVWKGSLEQAPENPELYWSYHNTIDGNSYIFDGEAWAILASKGDQGEHGHTLVVDPAVEATCTHTGLTEGMHCIFCDYVYIEQKETPKAEHTKVVDVPGKTPSLLETGYSEASHCSVCGEVISTATELPVASPRAGNSRYGFDQFASEPNKQRFYDALYKAAEGVIENTDDYLPYDEDFYIIDSFDVCLDYGLTIEEAIAVWTVFENENPRYYFIGNALLMFDETVCLLIDKEYVTYEKRQMYDASISKMELECLELFDEMDMPLTKAVRIHDYIAGKITYAYQDDGITPETMETSVWTHNITGVSYLGRGVCEAYAKTFLYLCNLNEVECLIVSGNTIDNGESHAWNYICIDDEWYLVDVTVDDNQDIDGSYYNFGLSSKLMASAYIPDTEEGIGIYYQYPLPNLCDERMMLVDVYRNGSFIGVYSSPDSAFESMSGIQNEYKMATYGNTLKDEFKIDASRGFLASHSSRITSLPSVKKIIISHGCAVYYDESTSITYYTLGDLYFINDVTLECDLELQGMNLIVNTLHLNEHNLVFDEVFSYVSGFNDESLIEGREDSSSIITANVNSSPQLYVNVDVTNLNCTADYSCVFCSSANITNIYAQHGTSFIFRESVDSDVTIGNCYIPKERSMGFTITSASCETANLTIGNVICSDQDTANSSLNISINCNGEQYYPHLSIDGEADCMINVYVGGAVTTIVDKLNVSTGETEHYEVTEAANPFNINKAYIYGNATIDRSRFYVSFSSNLGISNLQDYLEYDNSYGVILSPDVIVGDEYISYRDSLIKYLGEKEGTIVLPEGYTIIGDALFARCDFSEIIIPDGYVTIGAGAFSNCCSLECITIPNSITSICEQAFFNCTNLTEINYTGTINQWNTMNKDYNWYENSSVSVIHCCDGDLDIYGNEV